MKTGYKVSDAMTENPIFMGPDDNIVDCAKKMREYKVGALIVKEGEKVAGICTEQDLVYKLIAENKHPEKVLMKDVMCNNVRTISANMDIFEAIMKMRDLNVRRLPVVGESGELVGLLTSKDVLKIEPQLFDMLVDKIDVREEERKPVKVQNADEEVDDIIHHD